VLDRVPPVQLEGPILERRDHRRLVVGEADQARRDEGEVGEDSVVALVVAGARPDVARLIAGQGRPGVPDCVADSVPGIVVSVEEDSVDPGSCALAGTRPSATDVRVHGPG
jgi:hypothetical protein